MSESTILHNVGRGDVDRASQTSSSDASGGVSQQAALTSPSPSNRLYDRRFSVVVGDASGKALDLSSLRCRFAVRQFDNQTPNYCDVRITNVSKATAERMVKEFTRLQISAGYPGLYGIIFDGWIVQARRGRENPTDTYLDIVATDGDQAHNWAVVNGTLAAGSTPKDVHRVVLQAMNPHGVTEGYTDPALTGPALPRGKVLFGMARDTMRDLTRSTNTKWAITNGRIDVVSRDGYLANEAVVINKDTGMVGMPAVQADGIYVRTLLNPLLRIAQRIKLNNDSIQTPKVGVQYQGGASIGADGKPNLGPNYETQYGKIEGDGIYKILAVDHFGDTRGNEWYSEIACVGASQGATTGSAQRGRAVAADRVAPLNSSPSSGSSSSSGSSDSRRDRDAYTTTTPAPLPAAAVAAPPTLTDTGGIVRNGHQIGY